MALVDRFWFKAETGNSELNGPMGTILTHRGARFSNKILYYCEAIDNIYFRAVMLLAVRSAPWGLIAAACFCATIGRVTVALIF